MNIEFFLSSSSPRLLRVIRCCYEWMSCMRKYNRTNCTVRRCECVRLYIFAALLLLHCYFNRKRFVNVDPFAIRVSLFLFLRFFFIRRHHITSWYAISFVGILWRNRIGFSIHPSTRCLSAGERLRSAECTERRAPEQLSE